MTTSSQTTRTRFSHNICQFMNWQGAPTYVEQIFKVEKIDPTNPEAGWTVKGYKWHYANRAGQSMTSRKVYATVAECEAAYAAWMETW